MMNDTFVREIRNGGSPGIYTVDNRARLMSPPGWMDHTPARPEVVPLKVGTLTGLVDYVKSVQGRENDGDDTGKLLIHILHPGVVQVVSAAADEDKDYERQTWLTADASLMGPTVMPFGHYLDYEAFMIALLSGFEEQGDRADLLTLIASIRDGSVREFADDGVGQEVKTGRSIHLVGDTRVRNPWELQPFRTFREVYQPSSPFVLRVRSGSGEKPALALFEADGGRWKSRAIDGIKRFLHESLTESSVPVIG